MARLLRPALLSASLLSLAACGPETSPDDTLMGNGGGGGGQAEQAIEEGDECEDPGAVVTCGEDQASFRFCDTVVGSEDLAWGPCVAAPNCMPGETEWCEWDGDMQCELIGGVPYWDDGQCADGGGDTPLVVVFGDARVEYAPVSMATFDTFAGGCTSHDWPTAATPWLALDRDGSGFIEDGSELFGSGTTLASGRRARNGFEALAELDENGDGVVSAADPAFGDLMVWQDGNADRVSAPGELVPVASLGLTELSVRYSDRPLCDGRGNCEIERAAASTATGTTATIVDVHLACQ